MKIVQVIPETYQEYYDHLSIVLFCFGCNLHCDYCYNYEFISASSNIIDTSAEQVIETCYHPLIDGLVFLGGEPTLYPERLQSIALYAKRHYNLDIKLFTNGTSPDVAWRGLREGWLDHISIDFKSMTDKIYLKGTDPQHEVKALLKQLSVAGLLHKVEVRTTIYQGMPSAEIEQIKNYCLSVGVSHISQMEFKLPRN